MSSVPVSQYEALRAEMRNLVEQAQKVHEIATQVISTTSSTTSIASSTTNHQIHKVSSSNVGLSHTFNHNSLTNNIMEPTLLSTQPPRELSFDLDGVHSEDEFRASSAQMSVSSEPLPHTHISRPSNLLYHGTWPVERTMWASEPTKLNPDGCVQRPPQQSDQQSVLSFASSSGGAPLDRVLGSPDRLTRRSMQQLEAKVDMVYSLLAMLGGQEHADMGDTLLALSTSPESCLAMRQSGCIPLLVQLVQSDKDYDTRKKASQALHNLIYAQPDEKTRKREIRVLKLLEQTSTYVDALKTNTDFNLSSSSSMSECSGSDQADDKHPVSIIANLMKHSFDEGHRQAICQLGGIHTIASLVENEHTLHGSANDTPACVLMRRYACMALTNLTFGDSGNKALLCSFREFMRALVVQLQSPSDELRQVTASVLRNLSWRADQSSKEILREVGTVTGLMKAGMATTKENTLKSILSALWNLSAHCTENKLEICAVENGLGFLVAMLAYKAPSSSLTINENAGGILRNISSQIAVRDDYREILRKHNCLQMLLEQLKSPSLTIVSNACGTLWNLSAKNPLDQEALWQMGAPAMLRSLNHSKHKMIATGSSAALKNLLNSRPSHSLLPQMDSTARAMDLPALPTLGVRKQKALLRDLDESLSETFENTDSGSPTKLQRDEKLLFDKAMQQKRALTTTKDRSVTPGESHEFGTRTDHDLDLVNGFSSLTLNEPSTSYKTRTFNAPNIGYETEEQPIDYSRKYSEPQKAGNSTTYAETDLDQPTDYSLRYAEDDSDSDCGKKEPEYVQDTIKTYYTEGTPYETPINFSTATSMSDLRIGDIDNDKTKDRNNETKAPTLSHLDEKDHCSVEDITDLEIVNSNIAKQETKPIPVPMPIRSEFSSGLMTPEKPVNYCEEGTPGYFSRVSSFGSLNSIPLTQENEGKSKEPATPPLREMEDDKKLEASPKAVKYAEETPLMFSRSSSLASLDSVEQHSIHDDRSSIVSDFSRLTSGIVSPSELPDSPTQTVPPSPRPRKTLDYSTASTSTGRQRPQPAPRSLHMLQGHIQAKPSVFEDDVTKFKEESTPAQFSTATSISSLTIDDQDESVCGDIQIARVAEEDGEKQDLPKDEKPDSSSEQLSENDEDDDILADCINIGMQNNRHRQTKPGNQLQASSKIPSRQGSGIPIPRTGVPIPRSSLATRVPSVAHADTTRTYYTEDTPAVLSHAGSNSDLSVLSMQTDNKSRKDYLSDDSSNLSGENDNILAECIQSGMPKAKTSQSSFNVPKRASHSHAVSTSTPIKPFTRENDNGKRSFLGAGDEIANFAVENSPCQFSLRSSLSDLTVDGSVAGVGVRTVGEGETYPSSPIPSGRKSNQGAGPSTTHNNTGTSCNTTNELSRSRQESLSSLSVESFGSAEAEQALLEQCISSGMPKSKHNVTPNKHLQDKPIGVATKQFNKNVDYRPRAVNIAQVEKENDKSKNVNAASVVGNTKTKTPAADGDADTNLGRDVNNFAQVKTTSMNMAEVESNFHDISLVKSSHTEENLLTALTKSGCEKSLGKILDSFSNSSISNSDNCADDNKSVIVDSRMLDPDAMIESLDRFTAELVSQATLNKEENKCTTSVNEGDTWNEDVTFPSITESAPNVITFSDKPNALNVDPDQVDTGDSLDTSTMTESTLIAMEATKMATTFQLAAEMTKSSTSITLELDQVQPPSQMNSISSVDWPRRSPRMCRKRSLPSGLMVRRALSNSLTLQQTGSMESITNLEAINPPSLMADIIDLDGSLISVASIASDPDQEPNPIFNVKQPITHMQYTSQISNSLTNLDNVNPPSFFNDQIGDLGMANSLADVATDFNTATEMYDYEDCRTDCDVTEFSDANSITPIQSDLSSTESTPKRTRTRALTPKERRSIAKERYLTYTVDADKIMTQDKDKEDDTETMTEDYRTVCATATLSDSTQKYSTATYTRSPNKLTPKERRQQEQARYQTRTLSKETLPDAATSMSKIGVRRRAENKDRFKTQIITTTSASSVDLMQMLHMEANKVLKSLKETTSEEINDETLSLVSNDDDSLCSINYRTYRKSSSTSSAQIPTLPTVEAPLSVSMEAKASVEERHPSSGSESEQEDADLPSRQAAKPKIVKPSDKPPSTLTTCLDKDKEPTDKAIRGRRKPLYCRNFKSAPIRAVTPPRSTKIVAKPPVPQPKLQKAKTAPIQREGTFTKDEKKISKIPSAIPKAASTSRIAKPATTAPGQARSKLPSLGGRSGLVKSASSDRANKPISRVYNRSPSVDSRIAAPSVTGRTKTPPPPSPSSPSHKNGAVKKTTTPVTNGLNATGQQITSRIASLWRQVEANKKQQPAKKDTRIWIRPDTIDA